MKTAIRFLVLVLAALQPVVAYLTSVADQSRIMEEAYQPLISPATYAFSIWGVICAGSVLYGVYQFFATRNRALYDRIAPYAIVVFAGFVAWLYAAAADLIWLTVAILAAMSYGLYRLYPLVARARRNNELSLIELVITYGTFGLYAGWATVAVFQNVAAALLFSGYDDATTLGFWWQGVLLAVGTMAAIYGIRLSRASIPYAGAVLWGFVAVAIALYESMDEAAPLFYASLVAIAALLAAFAFSSKKQLSR